MTILWSWDSRYGGSPHELVLEIPDEDLKDMTKEQQDRVIEDYVHEEFLDQVGYSWERKA